MKKTELAIVTIIAIALGTGMHFVHHASFFNHFMGYIFPINECVWEHMKMLFYPLTLVGLYLCITRKSAKPFGGMVLATLAAIPTQIALFYVYWIFTRHSITIVDVIAYVVVMIAAMIFGNKWAFSPKVQKYLPYFIGAAVVLAIVIAVLTYHPFDINLFEVEE